MTMSQPNQKSTFDTFTHWAKVQRQIYICDGVVPKTVGEVGEGSGIFAKRTVQVMILLILIFTFVPCYRRSSLTTRSYLVWSSKGFGEAYQQNCISLRLVYPLLFILCSDHSRLLNEDLLYFSHQYSNHLGTEAILEDQRAVKLVFEQDL